MNHKRKRPRTSPTHVSNGSLRRQYAEDWHWLGNWPRWWDVVFHSRPARRRDRARIAKLMNGADPDAMTWETGNSRPHRYYW